MGNFFTSKEFRIYVKLIVKKYSIIGIPPMGGLESDPLQPPPMSAAPPQSFVPLSGPTPQQPGTVAGPGQQYLYAPVKHHWFYTRNEGIKQHWVPFSVLDSNKLEEAFHSGIFTL